MSPLFKRNPSTSPPRQLISHRQSLFRRRALRISLTSTYSIYDRLDNIRHHHLLGQSTKVTQQTTPPSTTRDAMFSNLNLNLTVLLNSTRSTIIPLSSLLALNSKSINHGDDWKWKSFPGGTTIVLPATLTILILYLTLFYLQTLKNHPHEPEILPTKIPYIGHLLGMLLHGGRYLKSLGLSRPDLPIFTLPVPNSRIYIVTDPILAAAVQRASKTLSFTPLVPDLTKRILGLDSKTVELVRQNLDPEPGEEKGFLADIHDLVYSSLGPGQELVDLSLSAVNELAGEVESFVDASFPRSAEEGNGVEVNLLHWIRHFVTFATAKFLYGDENPLTSSAEGRDSGLEEAFWDFDNGLGQLLLGILPSITAKRPYYAREKLATALADYLSSGKHKGESVSRMVQKRVEIALAHGWDLREISRSEVSFLFAGIVNTATTSFWVCLRIFAETGLLQTVRRELEAAVVTTLEKEGKKILSLEKVRNCPTLMAVFKESLRVGSDNYSTRLVKEDTLLAGKYFLRKDSVVQIAGGVLHADKRIWGDDAGLFNPGRFLSSSAGKGENGNGNVHPAAFRAFGGGKTLCPGRHFATNEILAFVAILVLTFDLEPVEGRGGIKVPGKIDNVLPVHILEPREDVFVRVSLGDGRQIKFEP